MTDETARSICEVLGEIRDEVGQMNANLGRLIARMEAPSASLKRLADAAETLAECVSGDGCTVSHLRVFDRSR